VVQAPEDYPVKITSFKDLVTGKHLDESELTDTLNVVERLKQVTWQITADMIKK